MSRGQLVRLWGHTIGRPMRWIVAAVVVAWLVGRSWGAIRTSRGSACSGIESCPGDDVLPRIGLHAVLLTLVVVCLWQAARAVVRALRTPAPHITGPRVAVRALGARDAAAILRTIDDRVMAEHRFTADDLRVLPHLVRCRAIANWGAIVDVASGRVVGIASDAVDTNTKEVEVGLWIGPDDRGRGLAVETLELLSRLATASGLECLAETSVDNVAMRRSLERVGFVAEAEVVHHFRTGESMPALRYARRRATAAVPLTALGSDGSTT